MFLRTHSTTFFSVCAFSMGTLVHSQSFNINKNAVATLKCKSLVQNYLLSINQIPQVLSTWMSHNHLKFKILNILFLLHVIHPKLSFVPISPMLSHNQHYHPSTRPSQNSAVNPSHNLFLACCLVS